MSELVDVWGPSSVSELADAVAPALDASSRHELRTRFGDLSVRFVVGDAVVACYPFPTGVVREPGEPPFRVSVAHGTVDGDRALMAAICTHLVASTGWGVLANPSDDSTGYVERPPTP